MRRNVIYLMACTTVMILAVPCAGVSKGGTARKTVPRFVLTYAENQVEDYLTTQGAYKFAELVYERTGGRVEVQVNADNALGNEKTVIEQLQFSSVDFARVSLSPLAEFVPKLNVPQMPYPCTGREHMQKVLEGSIGTDFMNSFGSSSPIPLPWYGAGARSFYNTGRPIKSLDDMRGLRIRIQESELMMDTIQALRAMPVPMAFGDVYSDLQAREIDGTENNQPSYESARHYGVTQYFTLDEHTRVSEFQLAAQSTWDKLPEEYGSIIRDCARESILYERELWAERERTSEDKVRGAGCVMTELDVREEERFREAAIPIYEECCSEYVDIIDGIMDAGRR